MKPAKYSYSSASEIVGFKKFLLGTVNRQNIDTYFNVLMIEWVYDLIVKYPIEKNLIYTLTQFSSCHDA